MNDGAIVSIVALVGWLVLALGAYRSHRINASRTVRMALIWLCIFTGIALVFGMVI
ncbi:hypothetical protein OZN62_01790 [Aurantiacibacter sp. MUD11]|uniref:hypothetical protein n=1 Tax=Aurantiacibacter sp. MUD11 TaxID=3003265 RepID=UPI0022AA0A2D|nr:hypothetical protein [Aurantiacibacter sp. MUD11]WAT18335.1 hypothetical protein OZN62_01790 [Aurantiacibacter sp. MUD11]